MNKKYVITMMAQTFWDEYPRLYALGFTKIGMIPILYNYDDLESWLLFADIKTAKEAWDKYKDKVFEKYGNRIQKHNIFISEITIAVDKVEDIGERHVRL